VKRQLLGSAPNSYFHTSMFSKDKSPLRGKYSSVYVLVTNQPPEDNRHKCSMGLFLPEMAEVNKQPHQEKDRLQQGEEKR